jgi:EAL domain-containing protein (putative c-di-GMP-specific phosphodiesterase class I)
MHFIQMHDFTTGLRLQLHVVDQTDAHKVGHQMSFQMPGKKIPKADMIAAEASPLGFAISQADSQTLSMVSAALDSRRLRLAYQPVVQTTDTNRIAFYEGFIRILDPSGRSIPARDFIHVVESQELGRRIDCAALQLGLNALARLPGLRLSVNMSARSIGYPDWTRILRQYLKSHPLIGERLILEISESSAMMVPEIVIAFMTEMQKDGISFALDHFGSGFMAPRYFRNFLFDMVKIDGQFTRDVDRNPDNQVMIEALVSLARNFEMFAVAESVETVAEAEYLRATGVDCLQGYLFGSPTVKPDFLTEAMARAG